MKRTVEIHGLAENLVGKTIKSCELVKNRNAGQFATIRLEFDSGEDLSVAWDNESLLFWHNVIGMARR